MTCHYCRKELDLEKEKKDLLRISKNRWVHKKCHEEYQNGRLHKEVTIDILKSYINELFKGLSPNWPVIQREINKYLKAGMSLEDIQRTLIYCYEIKKIDPFKANGHIAIVERLFPEAKAYYKKIIEVNDKNISNFEQKTIKVNISSPKAQRNIKLIDFEIEENI